MRSSLRGKFALLVAVGVAGVLRSADATSAPTFDGVWLGHIAAPNTQAVFGLAFTNTEKGQLVSVFFPDMFLYSVNFGRAEIAGRRCTLSGLGLSVTREGDELRGTFGTVAFPIVLQRHEGSFSSEPAPAEYPPAPKPVWSRPLHAAAWASPTLAGDTVYVGTVDGAVHAFGLDGTERWAWKGAHPLYGAAAVTEDAVYVRNEADELVCLDRLNGQLRWQLGLYDEKGAGGPLKPGDPTFNHRAPSPVIDGKGVLYCGSASGDLCAVRAKTGKLLWRHHVGGPVFAEPLMLGDDLVVGGFDGSVVRINRRTQHEVFRVRLSGPVVSTPGLAGGRLIVGSRDTLLYGLDATTGKTVWRDTYWFSWVESSARVVDGVAYIGGSDFRRVSAIEPASGRTLWATDVQGLSWGSPVVEAETVYAGTAGQTLAGTVITHRGGIVAIDRKTGGVKWRYESAAPAGADFTGFAGSLVATDRVVMGASVTGELVALPLR